jgi:predicted transcriptional regulator
MIMEEVEKADNAKIREGPVTRGVPSKESIYFIYSKLPMSLEARWEVEDILKIVFPPQYKKSQYECAVKMVKFLGEEGEVNGKKLSDWVSNNKISESTLRNLVIPRLVTVGMIARERSDPTGRTDKDKRHEMILKLSTRFGEAFKHVGGEWNGIIQAWRIKKQ